MRRDTRAAAQGKWLAILQLFMSTDLLDGKHHDCPICSAKDKFRFTDYKSGGEWICTHGAGDGFDLLMEVTGSPFKAVAQKIDEIIGNNELPEVFQPEVDYESRRRNLNEMWAGATSQCHIDYLLSRGIAAPISSRLNNLRGHPSLWNTDTGERQQAMVALIRNHAGVPISVHRTFWNPKYKAIMPPTETISGGAVRLGIDAHGGTLVVGEGIETTLSGMEAYGDTGMAAISAHGMEKVIIPKAFDDIVILADHDASFTGQKAAFTLARRLDAENRRVRVIMTTDRGDYNDYDRDHDSLLGWNNVR